jgi:hypothetical protein
METMGTIQLDKKQDGTLIAYIDGIISKEELDLFWENNGEDGYPESVSWFFSVYEDFIVKGKYTDCQVWGEGQRSFADNIDPSKLDLFVDRCKQIGIEVEQVFSI